MTKRELIKILEDDLLGNDDSIVMLGVYAESQDYNLNNVVFRKGVIYLEDE